MKNAIKFLVLFCVFSIGAFAAAKGGSTPKRLANFEHGFRVAKQAYWFSAEFNIDMLDKDDVGIPKGHVTRTGTLTPWYTYDYVDLHGNRIAYGVTRALSLGLIAPSQICIDVYNAGNRPIGKIEGQFFTWSRAKFVVADQNNHIKTVAYLGEDSQNIIFVAPENEGRIIGSAHDFDSYGGIAFCDVKMENFQLLQDPLMVIFSSFVADYNQSFVPQEDPTFIILPIPSGDSNY